MKKIIVVSIVALIVLAISYFKFFTKNEKYIAIEKCIEECKRVLREGKNISSGPCLLNPIPGLNDWVCDFAHWPREEIDNLPENQCSYFREGKAHHFVEVDTSCNLIRVY
jgi:hypothetical protein